MEAPSPPAELPIMPQVARGVHQGVKAAPDGKPGGLEPAVEEEEPLQDIEMPPPMEIQDHTFKADTKDVSTDDVTAQLVSVGQRGEGGKEAWSGLKERGKEERYIEKER